MFCVQGLHPLRLSGNGVDESDLALDLIVEIQVNGRIAGDHRERAVGLRNAAYDVDRVAWIARDQLLDPAVSIANVLDLVGELRVEQRRDVGIVPIGVFERLANRLDAGGFEASILDGQTTDQRRNGGDHPEFEVENGIFADASAARFETATESIDMT